MRILFSFIITIALSNSFLLTQTISPYSFTRLNSSARIAALGGASTSLDNDASNIFFNPATLYTVDDNFITATFIKHALDINSGNAVYIIDQVKEGALAVSANYTGYGDFQYADNRGNRTGRTFGGGDISLGVTYSNELDSNFFYGVSLKYLNVTLENYGSSALAIDAGLLYKLKDGRTNIGLSILNTGFQLNTFAGYNEPLPTDVRLGINHRLRGLPLLINFTFHSLADDYNEFSRRFANFSIGGEVYAGKYIMLRAGYDNHVRQFISPDASAGISGFSGGVGIKLDFMNFDYAFSRYGALTTLHRVTVSTDLR